MKNINREAQTWIQLITFLVILVVILYATGTALTINIEALKKLPEVVTVYTILYLVFTRWAWRLPFFHGWLVPLPDLEGTWEGVLRTTWRDPATGEIPPPIKIFLVIRQTFDSIACLMYTPESTSQSNAAFLTEHDDSGVKTLHFNYTNIPRVTVRDRSGVHDGAATLRVITAPSRSLEGEYWTNRRTTGEIAVVFKSRALIEAYPKE